MKWKGLLQLTWKKCLILVIISALFLSMIFTCSSGPQWAKVCDLEGNCVVNFCGFGVSSLAYKILSPLLDLLPIFLVLILLYFIIAVTYWVYHKITIHKKREKFWREIVERQGKPKISLRSNRISHISSIK